MNPSTRPVRRRKASRQRTAIVAALEGAEGFRTAQELHEELRNGGADVGLTTVYRNLQSLAEDGEIDVLSSGEGEAMYRRCEAGEHHHHLICRSCRRSIEIEADEVESWAELVARRHGFTSVSHVVELFGDCDRCARI
jgi:Fur family ferric uptake transcriptional regulator